MPRYKGGSRRKQRTATIYCGILDGGSVNRHRDGSWVPVVTYRTIEMLYSYIPSIGTGGVVHYYLFDVRLFDSGEEDHG